MPRWSTRVVDQIRRHVAKGRVRFTQKALRELLELDLDPLDAQERLGTLTAALLEERRRSTETGEFLYVFKTVVEGAIIYVKVVIREACIVVSFHEDRDSDEEDELS